MRNTTGLFALVFFVSISIQSCGIHKADTVGAKSLIDDASFETFDENRLASALDPEGMRQHTVYLKCENCSDLEKAFHAFYTYDEPERLRNRNRIQDRLIAASNQRCGFYTKSLKQMDVSANLGFGTATTILGSAGAIVTGVDAARTLAGMAAISSGLNSVWNENLLSNVATYVLVPGIEKARETILKEIDKKRIDDVTKNTVEAAIADALRYHNACSLDAGLAEVSEEMALSKTRTQTVSDVNKVMDQRSKINLAEKAQKLSQSSVKAASLYQQLGAMEAKDLASIANGLNIPHNANEAKLVLRDIIFLGILTDSPDPDPNIINKGLVYGTISNMSDDDFKEKKRTRASRPVSPRI